MHPLIESHRHPLIEPARRRGIGNVRVFGSMARGDADTALVGHMRECLLLIAEYTGHERARFEASRMVQDAVIRNLPAQRCAWCAKSFYS